MISSITELENYSTVILLYYTGSSGEFVASALSQCINEFASPSSAWLGKNRVTFADALGKTLNGGWHTIQVDDAVRRFNEYMESKSSSDTHLILAHPDNASINFIKKYLNFVPVIEITTQRQLSRKFRELAQSKVSYSDFVNGGDNQLFDNLSKEQYITKTSTIHNTPKHYRATRHLCVEWEKLLVTDVESTFNSIINFLNCTGSNEQFKKLAKEYLDRNQDILALCDC
jgi:hypothetical protein